MIVTREPEWDDAQRDAMLGLGLFESGVHDCGFHKSLAGDKDNVVAIEEDECAFCRGAAQYDRVQKQRDREHEDRLGDNAPAAAPRPSDGRITTMRLLSPLEVEMRRKR